MEVLFIALGAVGSMPLALIALAAFGLLGGFALWELHRHRLRFSFTLQDYLAGLPALLVSGLSVLLSRVEGAELVLGLLTHYLWQAGFVLVARALIILQSNSSKGPQKSSSGWVFLAGLLGFFTSLLVAVLALLVYNGLFGSEWL